MRIDTVYKCVFANLRFADKDVSLVRNVFGVCGVVN